MTGGKSNEEIKKTYQTKSELYIFTLFIVQIQPFAYFMDALCGMLFRIMLYHKLSCFFPYRAQSLRVSKSPV